MAAQPLNKSADKPADRPDVHVCVNHGRPGLVHIAVGSGTDGYSITPELAERIALQLVSAVKQVLAASGAA